MKLLLSTLMALMTLTGCNTQQDLKQVLKQSGYSDNCIEDATSNDNSKYITNDTILLAATIADGCKTRELIQSLKDK